MSDISNNESDQDSSKATQRTSIGENVGKQGCQKQEKKDDSTLSSGAPQEEVASSSSEQSTSLTHPQFTLRQQNAQKLLLQFAKTFITVMESTVFAKSDWDDEEADGEAEEYFDNFGCNDDGATSMGIRMNSIGLDIGRAGRRGISIGTIGSGDSIGSGLQPISDEEFPYETYFPGDQKEKFRSIFTSVAFDMFTSYEYQLIMLVREKRKIAEIAEDIVHRILENFKESTRGTNPEYIKPEITTQFLIEKALHHSEPEGIIYNSEWSAVEILENPGIIVKAAPTDLNASHTFYQSHWQKNFIGVKKLIGYKYGFRLNFNFETERTILLQGFEKVRISSVSPLYLSYEYCLDSKSLEFCKDQLARDLEEEDMKAAEAEMKSSNGENESVTDKAYEENLLKDRARLFQSRLQIQRIDEEKNSDKVMKQIADLSHRFETLHSKLAKLEQKGVINSGNIEEVNRAKAGLLRSNYHVRFEVRNPSGTELHKNLFEPKSSH